jgi:predicted PurR-regulated permease PerM
VKKDEPLDYNIVISTGTILRTILVVLGFVTLWYLRDILMVVLTAIILASAIEPAVRFFGKRGIPRLLALVFVYLSGAGIFGGIFYFFVPALFDDIARLADIIPKYVDLSSLWSPLASGSSIAESLSNVGQSGNLLTAMKESLEAGGALKSYSVFFGGFLSFILIIVLSFYLSAQEHGIENLIRLVSPIKSRAYVLDLWRRSQQKIGLWSQGQILLGVLVGVLVFLTMTLMGIPSALFLALIAMLFELIPVFGPILSAVPGLVLAFGSGINPPGNVLEFLSVDAGINAAIIVAVVYFLIQQFESHLIYPLVVRKVIGIPPVLVILALIVGAKVAGFLGIILSVPITAILMEFLNDVAKEKKIFEDLG